MNRSETNFIHKLKIAAKEAGETEYGLELCEFVKTYPSPETLIDDIRSILKVLGKIIATSKRA